MATSEMDYMNRGGGSKTGTFTMPVSSDGTITVSLPFTPTKVAIYYKYASVDTYCEAICDTDAGYLKSFDVVSGGTPSKDRITLAVTTNGFTVAFTATAASTWQSYDAYYIAIA